MKNIFADKSVRVLAVLVSGIVWILFETLFLKAYSAYTPFAAPVICSAVVFILDRLGRRKY